MQIDNIVSAAIFFKYFLRINELREEAFGSNTPSEKKALKWWTIQSAAIRWPRPINDARTDCPCWNIIIAALTDYSQTRSNLFSLFFPPPLSPKRCVSIRTM